MNPYKYVFIIFVLIQTACLTPFSELPHSENSKFQVHKKSINTGWKYQLLDKYFKNLYTNSRFNGGILISKKGNIIYKNYYGYQNRKNKDTLSFKTEFQLGSVSKQFTAIAILKLFEDHKLSLNDSVQKFFQNFPYHNITVEMLLSHRSGLSNYLYFCEKLTNREKIISNIDVVNLMIKHNPSPYFPPDRTFDYCNTNYAILAAIVEKITQKSFAKYLKDEIFNPLGMHNTYIFHPDSNRTQNQATGYHYNWLEALPVYQDGVSGDKNIYSTLEDLFIWDRALYSEKIIRQKTLAKAFEAKNPDLKNKNYGFGWRILRYENRKNIVYHGGWWRGFTCLFIRDPETESCIIIYSNVRTNVFYNNYLDVLKIINPNNCYDNIIINETIAK